MTSLKAYHRQADLQDISCSPRVSLSRCRHSSIDTLLKDLRACSRRLRIALEAHANESQVLERLYYKGKNQHRGALFWRRVAEVRRYSGRLSGIHADNVVEMLRRSFFGEGAYDNSKLTKGSWTHFPNNNSMLFVLERLSASSALVEKMDTRLADAYRFFTLAMQSGAFLQLVLTLLALVSRLGAISLEILEVLQATSKTIRSILEVVSAPETEWPVHGMAMKGCISAAPIGEDTGSANEHHTGPPPAFAGMATNEPSVTVESLPLSCTVVKRTAIKGPGSDRLVPEDKTKIRRGNTKRINMRDEIDEIFGF